MVAGGASRTGAFHRGGRGRQQRARARAAAAYIVARARARVRYDARARARAAAAAAAAGVLLLVLYCAGARARGPLTATRHWRQCHCITRKAAGRVRVSVLPGSRAGEGQGHGA
jgi:hypothetical protein